MRLVVPVFIGLIGFVLMYDVWWGDPMIYLCYAAHGPLTFNPGTLSTGATSPLWALILSVWPDPLGFKIISAMSVFAAMWVFDNVAPYGAWAVLIAAPFGFLGYETGLMLLVCGLFVMDVKKFWWLAAVMPFVRPELIVVPILYSLRGNFTWMFLTAPYIAYLLVLSEHVFPLMSVFGREHTFSWRYELILLPWMVRWGDDLKYAWIVSVFVFIVFINDEFHRGYTFDVVAETNAASWLNNFAERGARIKTHEVQIRYLLRDDLVVVSDDGIIDMAPADAPADYLILSGDTNVQFPNAGHVVNFGESPKGFRGARELWRLK